MPDKAAGVLFVDLVEGRECGTCNVCCVTTQIDTDEFKKLPGVRCRHLCAQGCSIYATRYSVCRTYHCGWRYLGFLSDNWRPDKSGVLLAFTPANELPAGYTTGMSFIIAGPPPQSISRALYHYIAHLIADGVYVTLAVPGPAGHYPAVSVLNDQLRNAASQANVIRVEAALLEMLKQAKSARFTPVPAHHAPGS
jgi:hypothetical protein